MVKYKVINTRPIPKENFLEYYLGNTEEEATETYKEFELLLKKIANSYSQWTNLSKYDLFAEAITGLARAKRDYTHRNLSFKNYAIYRIKEAIHTFIRKNQHEVAIPNYIQKASILYRRLKFYCDIDTILSNEILIRYAKREGISCQELVDRIEMIETIPEDNSCNYEAELINALTIKKIRELLNEEERHVIDGIMEDKTYREIAVDYNKPAVWVHRALSKIKRKVTSWEQLHQEKIA